MTTSNTEYFCNYSVGFRTFNVYTYNAKASNDFPCSLSDKSNTLQFL